MDIKCICGMVKIWEQREKEYSYWFHVWVCINCIWWSSTRKFYMIQNVHSHTFSEARRHIFVFGLIFQNVVPYYKCTHTSYFMSNIHRIRIDFALISHSQMNICFRFIDSSIFTYTLYGSQIYIWIICLEIKEQLPYELERHNLRVE